MPAAGRGTRGPYQRMLNELAATEARALGPGDSTGRVRFDQKTPLRNYPKSMRATKSGGGGFSLPLGSHCDCQEPRCSAGLKEAASKKKTALLCDSVCD